MAHDDGQVGWSGNQVIGGQVIRFDNLLLQLRPATVTTPRYYHCYCRCYFFLARSA
jgi:hypothetical protein